MVELDQAIHVSPSARSRASALRAIFGPLGRTSSDSPSKQSGVDCIVVGHREDGDAGGLSGRGLVA
jgi:hypothetical protein